MKGLLGALAGLVAVVFTAAIVYKLNSNNIWLAAVGALATTAFMVWLTLLVYVNEDDGELGTLAGGVAALLVAVVSVGIWKYEEDIHHATKEANDHFYRIKREVERMQKNPK